MEEEENVYYKDTHGRGQRVDAGLERDLDGLVVVDAVCLEPELLDCRALGIAAAQDHPRVRR